MPPAVRPPLAVLFACSRNAVRSPMAAALFGQIFGRAVYVVSAGVRKGEPDGFATAAMAEIGLDISRHKPITLEELEEWEGLNFDLDRHAGAGSASPGTRTHQDKRRRRRILADTPIRPRSRETASSGSTLIAKSAISFWRASASVSSPAARGTSDPARCVRTAAKPFATVVVKCPVIR